MKRCSTCKQTIPEKPRVEVVTVEGISYTINHWEMGRTVDSPCSCFGGLRCHSTHACPWMAQRLALKAMSDEDRARYLVAREVTETALASFAGQLTEAQTNALFQRVAKVSLAHERGVITAGLVQRSRGSVHVSIYPAGPGRAWNGTIGPNGGARAKSL